MSVPVNFSNEQKAATLRAARTAGFAVARLLEEPVAAAVAHDALLKTPPKRKKPNETTTRRARVGVRPGRRDAGCRGAPLGALVGNVPGHGLGGGRPARGEDFDRALLEWAREKLSSLPEPIFFQTRATRERTRARRGGGPRRAKRRMTRTIVPVMGTRLSSRQTPRGLTRAAFTSARSARWNSPRDT